MLNVFDVLEKKTNNTKKCNSRLIKPKPNKIIHTIKVFFFCFVLFNFNIFEKQNKTKNKANLI